MLYILLFLLSTVVTSDLCVISTFFNPFKHQSRITNFYQTISWWKKQHFRFIIVELVFGLDQEFQIQDSSIELIQMKIESQNVLWQKESLLNIGLNAFRNDTSCVNIAWVDLDVILEDGWVEKCEKMLEKFPIGQPFSHLVRLPKQVFSPFSYWSEPRMKRLGFGHREGQTFFSAAKQQGGYTGYAWAARKELLLQVKFYSKAIVGGFDALLVHALIDPRCEVRFNKNMAEDFETWAENARRVLGTQLGSPEDDVKAATFWHGDIKDRNYQDRHLILLQNNFDPNLDVEEAPNGALQWTSHASCKLRKAIFEMFINRNEDGEINKELYRYDCNLIENEIC